MRRILVLVLVLAACGGDPSSATSATSPSTTSTVPPSTTSPAPPVTSTTFAAPSDGVPAEGGRAIVTLTVDDEERSVLVVVPDELTDPVSLVLVFHGFTGTSERVEEQSGFTDIALEEGFVVAYPQGAGLVPAWRTSAFQGDTDVRFVDAVVDLVRDALPVERVFAAGMSNGGGMVGRLACDRAELVEAIAPVAAAHPPNPCIPAEPVAVAAFHAIDDRIVRYDGFGPLLTGQDEWTSAWASRNGCEQVPETEPVLDGVDRITWSGCSAPVVLYRSVTGGHRWPGPDAPAGSAASALEASRIIWEFFDA